MRSLILIFLTMGLIGCSSLPQRMSGIHIGASADEVRDALGDPDGFSSSSLTYHHRFDTCVVSLENNRVSDIYCSHDHQAQREAIQRISSAFSSGFNQPRSRPVYYPTTTSCMSNLVGNTVWSSCY